ncbi:hypothetical protein WOLCODRAFT_64720 [Wolfiporia cocos MD-104 SS10]|uniref:Uncharacterized protein n=1 Tax=Wolfiporia cocos (strain MD-104) TaxID=742152 RepID=A0A2H3JDB3_WOLCO|nr:hypothetical protein WOLCODRAFT_64720 [Wolfiporia cocos MD-104 SS10]
MQDFATDVGVTETIHSFVDNVPPLLEALNTLSKLHPFVEVAVSAFTIVCKLAINRKTNNETVIALHVEMQQTIEVLLWLKKAEKIDESAQIEGITLRDILQSIAGDIKQCGNACDTYSKLRPLTQFVKAAIWRKTFLDFIQRFSRQRSRLVTRLTAHIYTDAMENSEKLDDIHDQMNKMSRNLTIFLRNYIPPEHMTYSKIVEEKQGSGSLEELILYDEDLLQKLSAQEGPHHSSLMRNIKQARNGTSDRLIQTLREQFQEPSKLMEKNLQSFQQKFELQSKQILDRVGNLVKDQGDRIIRVLEDGPPGPRDRLIDEDVFTIWTEMGWHGSAKSRHFVLAIRDYYIDKAARGSVDSPPDHWALEHLMPRQLQCIIDAIDCDASGFITVSEANTFTRARPEAWSLLRWLAYWAVGWQSTATRYLRDISTIIDKMTALIPKAHAANRNKLYSSCEIIWWEIAWMTSTFKPFNLRTSARQQFQDYVAAEERRIYENLCNVRFRIDDLSTLVLVTGPGRIEQHLFPLLFLMLQQVLRVFEICKTHIITRRELWDYEMSFVWIRGAFQERFKTLRDLFQHQGIDPGRQFKKSYCGLIARDETHALSIGPSSLFEAAGPSSTDASQAWDGFSNYQVEDVLKHPLVDPIDSSIYESPGSPPSQDEIKDEDSMNPLLGKWNGHIHHSGHPASPMFAVRLHPEGHPNESRFYAACDYPGGTLGAGFTLTGEYHMDTTGRTQCVMTLRFAEPFSSRCLWGQPFGPCIRTSDELTIELAGGMNEDMNMLIGWWKSNIHGEEYEGQFVMSRLPTQALSYRPQPSEVIENRTKALWRFALAAAEEEALRRTFSWTYFRRRRDERHQYITLLSRIFGGESLDQNEVAQIRQLRQRLSPADAVFYELVWTLASTRCSRSVNCDVCSRNLLGSRVICMDCQSAEGFDLCDRPECMNAVVGLDKRPDLPDGPHLPSHNLLKSRKFVYIRDRASTVSLAFKALKRVQKNYASAKQTSAERTSTAEKGGLAESSTPLTSLRCARCRQVVSLPCWLCVDCTGKVNARWMSNLG